MKQLSQFEERFEMKEMLLTFLKIEKNTLLGIFVSQVFHIFSHKKHKYQK